MTSAANDPRARMDIGADSMDAAEQMAYNRLRELLDLAYRRDGLLGVMQAVSQALDYYRYAAAVGDEPEFRRKPNLLRGCAATAFTVEWCSEAIEAMRQEMARRAA